MTTWSASDLELVTESGSRLLLKQEEASAADGSSTSGKAAVEWVLRGDRAALKDGIPIHRFDNGQAELVLRAVEQEAIPSEVETPQSPRPADEPKSTPEPPATETVAFIPGADNQAEWPAGMPYLLGFLILLAALVILFRRPERIVEDSPKFQKALGIWQECLMLRQQTPRTIKRFLNHLRYLAMRYRQDEEPWSIWQRWIKGDKRQIDAPVIFSEPALVALSMLFFLEPSWVRQPQKFNQVNAERFDVLIDDVLDENGRKDHQKREELVRKLTETVQAHKSAFGAKSLATDKQRRHFLDARSEAAVR